jgi:hypothetical protein
MQFESLDGDPLFRFKSVKNDRTTGVGAGVGADGTIH